MLELIHVRNYAVVDDVELELGIGLNVVTGETGAGKSILVDALGLALGDRADAASVRAGAERAEVSVQFDCPAAHPVLARLAELDLDDGTTCLLRRVVGHEGRSRAFINGRPVSLSDVRKVGALLVDIHGQHAHQSLLSASSQRSLIDAHGGLGEQVDTVTELFAAKKAAMERLVAQQENQAGHLARLELLRFQASELEALGLGPGEVEKLEAERRRLANADRLAGGLDSALNALYDAEVGAAQALISQAQQDIAHLVEHDESLAAPAEQLAAAEIELREIAHSLAQYRDGLEADPARLDWIESRLATARHLASRHGVEQSALPAQLESIQQEIEALDAGGQSAEVLQQEVDATSKAYQTAAQSLSKARKRCAKTLGAAVTAELAGLGMPQGELRIAVEPKPEERADRTGIDQVTLHVRINSGQRFGPLANVASGGELSRLSLALEAVAANASDVPTLVFDEVDSGIGGAVAEIVGRKLAAIAAGRQVLCVTHLPQVASQGSQHYRVSKQSDGTTTHTQVRQLDAKTRIEELSRMLGGVEVTKEARAHAKEMIRRAATSKP